ncbi:23S rRNA (adenine(2030)-N(6))-methyltransferase RlmJ [Undibacterium sp. FT137W]|uniref:Ribosomal RNA large subunit methyltransferase J n=1 Tax=Undibacterium fentianense TaxID=2828728 RepID=A0A941DZL5_9BURK|nr:23S rRNA (adenine(2030)-N(6))-methyltransferase RlmJ [Undibacterium fentianense]
MLSYRHGFHAGNHADVLKHFVLIELLNYLGQKETAYTYVDTHSGAGLYSLDTGYATKNAEFETGIGPLWDREDIPAALQAYLNLVKAMNPSGKMRYYPGSPYCANEVMRSQDRLRLFELHPSEIKILSENFRKLEAHKAEQGERQIVRGKRIMINAGDGFEGLKAILPPPSRRGLVLIDPPYEVKDDYRKVRACLEDALVRFPTGTYAVWYPVLSRIESKQLPERLKRIPVNGWLNVTLSISGPSPDGFGLHSSGMFIINPPWTLEATLREVMPYLTRVLGKDTGARYEITSGDTEIVRVKSPVRNSDRTQTVRNATNASGREGGASGSLRTNNNHPNRQSVRNGTAPSRDLGQGKRTARPANLAKSRTR